MPIYEYQCTACGHKLEAFQRMSEEPLKECPECHEPALKKCVTAAAFQLKGSGWYATDFKDQKKPAEKSEEKTTNKKDDAGKSEATKSDSKTDTKDSGDKGTTAKKSQAKSDSTD